jgi:hypothetical protein
MRIYLRIINPIIAVIVLLLCLWASGTDQGIFSFATMVEGGLPTYFLAKGLFCSLTLFILGKILARMLDKV